MSGSHDVGVGAAVGAAVVAVTVVGAGVVVVVVVVVAATGVVVDDSDVVVVVVVVVDVFDDGLVIWKSPFEGSKSASSLAHLWQRYGQISTKLAMLQRLFVP